MILLLIMHLKDKIPNFYRFAFLFYLNNLSSNEKATRPWRPWVLEIDFCSNQLDPNIFQVTLKCVLFVSTIDNLFDNISKKLAQAVSRAHFPRRGDLELEIIIKIYNSYGKVKHSVLVLGDSTEIFSTGKITSIPSNLNSYQKNVCNIINIKTFFSIALSLNIVTFKL